MPPSRRQQQQRRRELDLAHDEQMLEPVDAAVQLHRVAAYRPPDKRCKKIAKTLNTLRRPALRGAAHRRAAELPELRLRALRQPDVLRADAASQASNMNIGPPKIGTFVVALGAITDPTTVQCFTNLASAGGHPSTSGPNNYYVADTEALVHSQIDRIVASTICRLDISRTNSPSIRIRLGSRSTSRATARRSPTIRLDQRVRRDYDRQRNAHRLRRACVRHVDRRTSQGLADHGPRLSAVVPFTSPLKRVPSWCDRAYDAHAPFYGRLKFF